jgi:Anti-sigma-28 factor, FlgM
MTALALTTPRSLAAPATRFGRTRTIAAVPEVPQTKIDTLRSQVECGTYTVDPGKIADAIVARLLAGRCSREPSQRAS